MTMPHRESRSAGAIPVGRALLYSLTCVGAVLAANAARATEIDDVALNADAGAPAEVPPSSDVRPRLLDDETAPAEGGQASTEPTQHASIAEAAPVLALGGRAAVRGGFGLGVVAPEVTGASGYTRAPAGGFVLDAAPHLRWSDAVAQARVALAAGYPAGILTTDTLLDVGWRPMVVGGDHRVDLGVDGGIYLPTTVAAIDMGSPGGAGADLAVGYRYAPWDIGARVSMGGAVRPFRFRTPPPEPVGAPLMMPPSPMLICMGADLTTLFRFACPRPEVPGVRDELAMFGVGLASDVGFLDGALRLSLEVGDTFHFLRPINDAYQSQNAAPSWMNNLTDGPAGRFVVEWRPLAWLIIGGGIASAPLQTNQGSWGIPLLEVIDVRTWGYNTTRLFAEVAVDAELVLPAQGPNRPSDDAPALEGD